MATNDWKPVPTNDYDLYESDGVIQSLPENPVIDGNGHIVLIPDEPYFSPGNTIKNSTMDKDPNNTGPTTDFWTNFPISIDINGDIYYYNENTGINVRGPQGISVIKFDELTPEQIERIKGKDGTNGTNGRDGADGQDGANGLSAYEVWLQDQGYDAEDHPISEFYEFLANYVQANLIKAGTGTGSIQANYNGNSNQATGRGSFASGENTLASGENSFAMGLGTKTTNNYQVAMGAYNIGYTTNIFEIGNGTSTSLQNIFAISYQGNLVAAGDIIDGQSNRLSNKVDKIQGKSLSTNDFTNSYKAFIDNYVIDTSLNPLSNNPLTNSAIYQEISSLREEIETNDITQELKATNTDLNFIHPTVAQDIDVQKVYYTNNITWNPARKVLKAGAEEMENVNDYEYNNSIGIGNGLYISNDNQIVLGTYNDPDEDNVLEIGNGITDELRSNLFTIKSNGNIKTLGDIIDGGGNTLSLKQDRLIFDNTLIAGSPNVVSSGNILAYLSNHGMDPVEGLIIPEIPVLQAAIVNLQTQINTLSAYIQTLVNPHTLIDDTTEIPYHLGVNNGELYIQSMLVDPPSEEEEEEEETNPNTTPTEPTENENNTEGGE